MPKSADDEKRNAALAALEFVEDGMTIGLGTGSTAAFFVEYLAEEVAEGLVVRGVPTSEATRRLAEAHAIPLVPIDQVERIHICVDGADEIDAEANLIKGGGGALLREKIVASASDHMIVIADNSKQVERLGHFPLPVEVTPFGFTITAKKIYDALKQSGVMEPKVRLRETGEKGDPFVTDGGNYILDCACGLIPEPRRTAMKLALIPGVVEHGLFIDMARSIIFGDDEGAEVLEISH